MKLSSKSARQQLERLQIAAAAISMLQYLDAGLSWWELMLSALPSGAELREASIRMRCLAEPSGLTLESRPSACTIAGSARSSQPASRRMTSHSSR